ncbi:serine hydrolase domain-containing protein [Paenibacillus sp. 481]|uniref:serine hydrolase domain-containing protein n=1 Tax=Paenibacillus sp. 481 TaxID=2835869 RepID=UPI001E47B4B6|nr:serine hydrolase domain-containing protein [Paenibacillus sp. 481]UHA73253.1 beta-lactamase family protein [Paenibacillus sp. 481]
MNHKRRTASLIRGLIGITIITLISGWLGLPSKYAYAEPSIETAKIDRFIQSQMDHNQIPGLAVAVVHRDRTIYAKGFGITGEGLPVTTKTPFAIASLSKSITALAVMQLVEAGKINLDAPIATYIPSFKLADPRGGNITVRQLLNHTSGLKDTHFPEMTFDTQPSTLEQSITRMQDVKLASHPGQQFHYHNPNYLILARLVEVVGQERFPDYLQKHIFQPLQMKHTFDIANTEQFVEGDKPFSKGHILVYGKPVVTKEPEWFVDGSAGTVSTVEDMAHWLKMQLNGGKHNGVQLFSSEGVKSMHSPAGVDIPYGMGWSIAGEKEKIFHNGLLWTYYAEQVLLPKSGYGIVVLYNSGFNPLVNYSSFTQGISDILSGQEPEQPALHVQIVEIIIALITVVTVGIGIRRLLRLNQWEQTYHKRAKWVTWFFHLVTLIPLLLLMFFPQVLTFIAAGRVLSWERIILAMPSIFIWLVLAAVFSVVVVICRCARMYKMGKGA